MAEASSTFIAAANFLADGSATSDISFNSKVERLLHSVGLNPIGGWAETDHPREDAIRLLRAAASFDNVFRLRSRTAPGLTFFGGFGASGGLGSHCSPKPPVGVSGAGETAAEAFKACIGEGVEYASQFAGPGLHLRSGTLAEAACWNGDEHAPALIHWIGTNCAIDWIRAERSSDRRQIWLPACLAVRSANTQRWVVGSGCAAGPTIAAARRAALFEIIERDAIAMWWRGDRRLLAITPDHRARLRTDVLLDRIRQDQRDRVTSLFQIPCDFGLICVAALSFDLAGRGFAGGYACHSDPISACRSAIREMCQMELSNDIVAARLARGENIQNPADCMILNRRDVIRPDTPKLQSAAPASIPSDGAPDFDEVVTRLGAAGFESYAVDLTTEVYGVPVAKIVVPGLQPYPSTFVTQRLAAAIAARPVPADTPDADLL